MTVDELRKALEELPGDLEVCVMEHHGYVLDEACIDLARRLPDGVPFVDGQEWKWENDHPSEQFSERVVVIY